MDQTADMEARHLAWQARTKRACLYMFALPVLAYGLLRRGFDPVTVIIGVMAVIFAFILFVLWTYAKL